MAEAPIIKEEKTKVGNVERILREICSLVLWLFFFIKVVVFDIDVYLAEKYASSFRWILDYRFFGLLILISIALLLSVKKRSRKFLVYVIAYPLIILFWKLPKLIFRNWALAIAFAPAVYELIRSFRFTFILMTVASVSALSIVFSSNPFIIVPSMVFLGLYLIMDLYRNLRRAYRSSIFQGLADLIKKLRVKFASEKEVGWKKVEYDPASEKSSKDYESQLLGVYFVNWGTEFISEKLYEVAKSRKPDLYLMASWLRIVIVTSLIYAFEYWALYKMMPLSFSSDYSLNFWCFWGFSFGKFTPSSISSIRPISTIASVISYSELFCALIILVIFVFSVLTAARERYKDDIDDFITEVRTFGNEMQEHFFLLYNLALSDVEGFLLRNNAGMINWLRKARGLPELRSPEADEKKPK